MESLTKKELIKIAKEKNIKVSPSMRKSEILGLLQAIQDPYNFIGDTIRADMLDQLERNGVVGEFYIDLVNDYMAMWNVKNRLIDDINEKGVSVKYQNGENQWGYKKNDCVAELQRTNNQMLKLLDHLGLKPSKQDDTKIDYSDMEM